MSMQIYTVVVRDMEHLSCAPSVILFEDEALAIHYIYNALPALISAEVGFDVYMQSATDSPLFSKIKAVAVDPAHTAHVTVSLSSKWTHSRSQP